MRELVKFFQVRDQRGGLSLITIMLMLAIMVVACDQKVEITKEKVPTQVSATQTSIPSPTLIPTLTVLPTMTPFSMGPATSQIPAGYNPLTGQLVSDPTLLDLPAVLISITNFPPSARPQAGLSYAAWVFELYISEGMTRFLGVYYGDYPSLNSSSQESTPQITPTTKNTSSSPGTKKSIGIGPIRSGRLPYAYVRDFFRSSCLVYAGATYQIRDKLRGCSMIYGSDSTDINSAMLDVTKLKSLAETNFRQGDDFNYSGNKFVETLPANGEPALQMDIYYSLLNQGRWKFDEVSQKYLKFEDLADGSGALRPMTDRLNGNQLAFSNVVVLFAEHTVLDPYVIDVALQSGLRGKAIIFRNGMKYDAIWSTMNGDYEKETGKRRPMHFEDLNGNPFPLDPGQTWIHIFTPYSYLEQKSDGNWLLRFMAPAGTK